MLSFTFFFSMLFNELKEYQVEFHFIKKENCKLQTFKEHNFSLREHNLWKSRWMILQQFYGF